MKTENSIIEKLIAHIESECDAIDCEKAFDEMLDECYSFEDVGGPFASMCPSRVLKECDPVAYRCGVNDYFGSGNEYVEIAAETYRSDEVEAARESFLDELDSQISDLETEINDAEAEEDLNVSEVAEMKRKLADLQADYQTVKNEAL